jgi:2-(3-amino-3-carboxypropyl)histidine synthase
MTPNSPNGRFLAAETIEQLRAKGRKKILVQLPEGLKPKAAQIATELRESGFDPVISGDACFGACDLRALEGATTLHVGHNQFLDEDGGNVVYLPFHHNVDCAPVALEAAKILPQRIGIVTTVQHVPEIGKIKSALESKGKTVVVPPTGRYTRAEGQILGCDVVGPIKIAKSVDAFLYVGSGLFHPIGLAYWTDKPVFAADPFTGKIERVEGNVYAKEKSLRQAKALNAKSFGIVLSSKPGQYFPRIAESVKQRLEAKGARIEMIHTDLVTPDALRAFGLDAFVITACPRIVIDDWKNYPMPILLPDEV